MHCEIRTRVTRAGKQFRKYVFHCRTRGCLQREQILEPLD